MVAPGEHPIYKEFAEALDLVEAKAHDYAEDDNVFSNFEFAAQVAGVKTVQVFAVLLGVKVARLGQLIGHDKVPNFESIDDTLLDTMNYAGLLKAYIRVDADDMTVKQAYDAAVAGGAAEAAGVDAEDAFVSHPLEGIDLDGLAEAVITAPDEGFKSGDIVQLQGAQGKGGIEYRITDINLTLGSVEAVPTKEWEPTLGKGVRTFAAERLELA